jgi:outer membrane protein assembly factor BamD
MMTSSASMRSAGTPKVHSAKNRRQWRALVLASAVVLGGALTGCSSKNDAKLLNPDPPDRMYAMGDALLTAGRHEAAAKMFEDLDRDHPYAPEARRAIVMSAFAYYKAGKYPEAISNGKRYTTLHPGTKDAALAHYVIASSYYDEMRGPEQDQAITQKALAEFKIIKTRYQESQYAKDVDNKIRVCNDSLAASEMNVGRRYLKDKQFVAAISRFEVVVKEYQNTAHVEEALMRLTEAYMYLGIKNEAQNAAAVLGHNFPDSPWYRDAYALLQNDGLAPRESSGSWLSKAWQGIKLPKISLN